jgi:hypothetical protein
MTCEEFRRLYHDESKAERLMTGTAADREPIAQHVSSCEPCTMFVLVSSAFTVKQPGFDATSWERGRQIAIDDTNLRSSAEGTANG